MTKEEERCRRCLEEAQKGSTAAIVCSGAALLGAPIGHDFCVISLSDRLTLCCEISDRISPADMCAISQEKERR